MAALTSPLPPVSSLSPVLRSWLALQPDSLLRYCCPINSRYCSAKSPAIADKMHSAFFHNQSNRRMCSLMAPERKNVFPFGNVCRHNHICFDGMRQQHSQLVAFSAQCCHFIYDSSIIFMHFSHSAYISVPFQYCTALSWSVHCRISLLHNCNSGSILWK